MRLFAALSRGAEKKFRPPAAGALPTGPTSFSINEIASNSSTMSFLDTLTAWGALAALLQFGIVLSVIIRVVLTRHPPGSSFAWILLTTLLPYVGFLLYLAFGERPYRVPDKPI